MKKAPLFFGGLIAAYLFFVFSTNLSYNFILSGAVATGNQPLPATTISVEFVSHPVDRGKRYDEPSHFPGGGYDLHFPAKNKSEVFLYYEKIGYGTLRRKFMLDGETGKTENSYVPLEVPVAHLFHFSRYETDQFVGSFNKYQMILFHKEPILTARQEILDLSDIHFFEETLQLQPVSLTIAKQEIKAHWYSVTLLHKSQKKVGYVLYEDEQLDGKP